MKLTNQHGDVLLFKVDHIKTYQKAKTTNSLIVAEGEATGHKHVVELVEPKEDEKIKFFRGKDGKLFFEIKSKARIVHEEHKPQIIDPGTYVVDTVKEYDYDLEEARKVVD